MRYFHHADEKLNLSKDIYYNTTVTDAEFDQSKKLWHVKTSNKDVSTWANHLILCTGFASKRYTPPFSGIEKFKGQWYHSGVWPEEGVDLKGKRVAIIGTGASGVQIIQEIGPNVEHLTVYQRTPNLAIPMRQCFLGEEEKSLWKFPNKERYEEIFQNLKKTFGALVIDMDFTDKKFVDSTSEERQSLYKYLWDYGGFSYWLSTYKEIFFLQEANDEVYNFWCEQTRARLTDPKKRDLLAPIKPPHAWGTKRPCLETSFYEVFNQTNVDIVNVRESPILSITENGVMTEKEGVIDVDVIIFATGFDSVTGGILNINIKNGRGLSIQDKWKSGTKTYLGLSTAEFPNLYWFYGPQAPTAFSNGPTTGTVQGNFVVDLMVKMRNDNKRSVVAVQAAEDKWVKDLHEVWYSSLFPATDSWYQGANIPGKLREPLNYFGGIPEYIENLDKCASNNYDGFVIE